MTNSDVTPIRTIDEHIHSVLKKWEGFDRACEKGKAARLDVALELRALKGRIEAGEVGDLAADDWWGWYSDNFRRSRGDAEKLLAIANAQDPRAAYEVAKARSTERSQITRKFRVAPKTQLNQSPADVGGDRLPAQRTAPRLVPTRLTEDPQLTVVDKEGIEAVADWFSKMSWMGRRETIKRINKMYQEWHGSWR